jgi:hypothetical protein
MGFNDDIAMRFGIAAMHAVYCRWLKFAANALSRM